MGGRHVIAAALLSPVALVLATSALGQAAVVGCLALHSCNARRRRHSSKAQDISFGQSLPGIEQSEAANCSARSLGNADAAHYSAHCVASKACVGHKGARRRVRWSDDSIDPAKQMRAEVIIEEMHLQREQPQEGPVRQDRSWWQWWTSLWVPSNLYPLLDLSVGLCGTATTPVRGPITKVIFLRQEPLPTVTIVPAPKPRLRAQFPPAIQVYNQPQAAPAVKPEPAQYSLPDTAARTDRHRCLPSHHTSDVLGSLLDRMSLLGANA